MWPRFGIKIGNSTLCTAYVLSENDNIEVLTNSSGDRISHACLFWNEKTGDVECGLMAKQKMGMRPYQAVSNSFQFLQAEEMPLAQLYAALRYIPCEYNIDKHAFKLIYQEPNKNINCNMHEYELNAYQVQVKLLQEELELARQYHHDIKRKPLVVFSIPSYYKTNARAMLQQVAEEAGFHVAQIIDEPQAASLAYNLPEASSNLVNGKFMLTIKCGGLFSHLTLYEVVNGQLTLHDEFGPFYIGGHNFTEVLVHYICVEFLRKQHLDPNESCRAMARIQAAANNAKHLLTAMQSTQIYIDSLLDGLDVNMHLTRSRFEILIRPVIKNFLQTVAEFINNEEGISNLVSIVLLGATMQIPKLRAAIAAQYPHAQIHDSLSSDEVVAIGCARQATLLDFPQEIHGVKRKEFEYTNEDIVIWHGVDDTTAKVILPKGTFLPYHVEVQLPMCKVAHNKELFQLRAGHSIEQVFIHDAQLNNDLMYCIEADVEYESEDDGPMPIIRLRCVSQKQLQVIFFNSR